MAKKTPQEHDCNKVSNLAILETKVDAIEHILMDNGRDGLKTTVIKLSDTLGQMGKKMDDNTTIISAVYKFMQDYETEKKVKEEMDRKEMDKVKKKQRNLTIIIGIAGFLIALSVLFLGNGIIKTERKVSYFEKVGPNTYIQLRNGSLEPIDSAYWDSSYKNIN